MTNANPVGGTEDEFDKIFNKLMTWCQSYKTFFPSLLTTRPNKPEHLPLETLSSQVLEFEGKARANPIGAPFRCYLLGKAPCVSRKC